VRKIFDSFYSVVPKKLRDPVEKGITHNLLFLKTKAMGAVEKSVNAGIHFSYLEWPSSHKPTIIVLHGFAHDKESFLDSGRILSKDYHVIVPDLPGFGKSDCPDLQYSFKKYADWIHQFVQALGLGKFHLLGNSLGGAIALQYSHEHAENIISLGLISPAGVVPDDTITDENIYDEQIRGENLFMINSMDEWIDFVGRVFHVRPYIPFFIRHHFFKKHLSNSHWYDKLMKDLIMSQTGQWPTEVAAEIGLNAQLPDLEMPIAIFWGKFDRLIPVQIAQTVFDLTNNSQLEIFDHLGHCPQVEDPKVFSGTYKRFLKNL